MSHTRREQRPKTAPHVRVRALLAIGQCWQRRGDRSVWTVAQIHRRDGEVRMVRETAEGAERLYVPIRDLRRKWRLLDGSR